MNRDAIFMFSGMPVHVHADFRNYYLHNVAMLAQEKLLTMKTSLQLHICLALGSIRLDCVWDKAEDC